MINEYIDKAQIAINEYLKSLKKGTNVKVYLNVVEKYFNDIYDYVKNNIDNMSSNDFARIHSLENSLNQFIIPFKTNLNAPNEVDNSDEYLLKTICYFTRKQLIKNESVDFESDSMRKYDEKTTLYVKDMCDRLGLLCYKVNIKKIFGIPKDHNINIVKVDDVYYLVDCTFQQFFLQGQNFKNRYVKSASHISTCEIGSKILYRNHGGALELLENGFISYEDEIFKDYFDTMLNEYDKKPLSKEEYLNMIIKNKKMK